MMRQYFRRLFFITLWCLWMGSAHAAGPAEQGAPKELPPANAAAVPVVQIPEPLFDFGEVEEGVEIEHAFKVQNTGKAPLQINQVRPGWGCTVAHFDREIPPGGEGKINLKVDLKGFQGQVKKTATVFTNDPQASRTMLTMQGIVKTLVDIRPANNITFRGTADQITETALDFTAAVRPFHINKVESNLESQISHRLETIEEGKHYRLIVSNRLSRGNYNGYIKCLTDLEHKPEIIIRVSGFIEGEVSVKPNTVLIGKLAAQQPIRTGKITVTSNRAKAFQIKKLTYEERYIEVSRQPQEQGYVLEITPKMENIPAGRRQQVTLTIETDVPNDEKHDVQVHVLNTTEASSGTPSVEK